MKREFNKIDSIITNWMKAYGLTLLRFSLAIIFIWFGFLKILGNSPANELVTKTIYWFDPSWFIPILGTWEVMIGICFLYLPLIRLAIFLLLPQMLGAFLPLILLPGNVYTSFPFGLTIEGQYIIKNLIIISSALVIGSHVRDNKLRKIIRKK